MSVYDAVFVIVNDCNSDLFKYASMTEEQKLVITDAAHVLDTIEENLAFKNYDQFLNEAIASIEFVARNINDNQLNEKLKAARETVKFYIDQD